jgi:cytochrome b561
MAHAQHSLSSTIPPRTATQTSTAKLHHSPWTITLHWITVVAILVCAIAALSRELTEDKALRIILMDIHRQSGLIVLVAFVLRLAVRFRVSMANHAGEVSSLERRAAQLAHFALYVLLLAMPLLGLAVSNAHAVQIKLFGLIPLPMLVGEDSDLADTLTDYHTWGAWALLALVVAHVGAACWHHWVRRDGVLAAMLPLVNRR